MNPEGEKIRGVKGKEKRGEAIRPPTTCVFSLALLDLPASLLEEHESVMGISGGEGKEKRGKRLTSGISCSTTRFFSLSSFD